ncbi:golgin subfamily A member 6-like protein 22 isoform X2 [Leptidea sinapis]|uniref:golgin subfamily A member 6-like protein 22 isoform X2 n=1 Tax=Leptidea sinapis TaxID=189913 RepID=UPI0021C3B6C7|nr:golgin subfamily A member 6-like protein 22 isoform X2 [Leptidea sinapis]
MPIAMTKDQWARIHKWTESNDDPDATRRRNYVKYLNDTSREMTKHWPNSLDKVNKRNEELRQARIAAAEEANNKFYRRYMRRKREEQQELMYSARETVFKNTDAPKLLLSAVIETVVQKEREEQIKFNKELQKLAMEQKKKDDDEIIRKSKEWHQLMADRKKKRFDADKKYQKEILEQAKEVAERNRTEYETELEMQKIDNMKADAEMDALDKFDEDFKAAEKARILFDMKRSHEEFEKRQRENEARDRTDDRLIEVLQKSRARVEAKRKQTEKAMKNEKLRILEEISHKLESGDAARDQKEKENLEKAVREKDAAAKARRQADANREAKIKQERIEIQEQFLEKERQRLHELDTMHTWDMMNRFKNAELYEDYQKKLRDEKKRKIQEYRADILKLWREREEREAQARADTRHFYGELAEQKLRAQDNKLFTYWSRLLEEARRHGRPDHALLRVRDEYCKKYRLYPMPELPTSMQEHFEGYAPRDLSLPDQSYRYPPPPAREPDEGEEGGGLAGERRDGLQPSATEREMELSEACATNGCNCELKRK